MTKQINIKINSKHTNIINEFKKAIIDLEGQYYNYFGDYVVEAMELYLHNMKHYPEKIGKEKHTFSNLTKSKQRTKKFRDYFQGSLDVINENGMIHLTFFNYLKTFFKKNDKTIREYQNEILTECLWSIINIPKSRKKLVLSRNSDLYPLVERFDETKGNYYSGLKPNKAETEIFKQIREKIMPSGKKPIIIEEKIEEETPKEKVINDDLEKEEYKNMSPEQQADSILGGL